MKEIYLVNTTIDPTFLDIDFSATHQDDAYRLHNEFIRKARMQVPRFGAGPYIALLSDGQLHIPIDPVGFSISGKVQDDKVTVGTGVLRLDDFITQVAEGNADLPTRTAIDAVVEFSPKELYPEVMRRLAQKYHISKVQVN